MKSILTKNQKQEFSKEFTEDGIKYRIVAELRFDDKCGNGQNSFAITGGVYRGNRMELAGCIHDEIRKHFPELRHLIKWHLCDTNGPMYYIENTTFHAGNYDLLNKPEGKPRNLNAAKECAIWPEATDEELSVSKERLTETLLDRLPKLMTEFKKAIETQGFIY